jgi:hypothetical protein
MSAGDVQPIRPVIAPPDAAKIEIVRGVLARLEAGEQFTGLAILLADNHQYEAPYDGMMFELLTAAVRFQHRINLAMDRKLE